MHVRANPRALNSSEVRGLGFSDCGRGEWVHSQLLENFVLKLYYDLLYLSIIRVDKLGGSRKCLISTTGSTMVSEVNLELF